MKTTDVSYSGVVTITCNNKQFVYKNNGTSRLFVQLCDFLAGKLSLSDICRPTYIQILGVDPDQVLNDPDLFVNDQPNHNPLTDLVAVTANSGNYYTTDSTSATYCSQFNSVITNVNLKSTAASSAASASLVLVGQDEHTILAVIKIDPNLTKLINAGSQANISWTIGFDNSTDAATSMLLDLIM